MRNYYQKIISLLSEGGPLVLERALRGQMLPSASEEQVNYNRAVEKFSSYVLERKDELSAPEILEILLRFPPQTQRTVYLPSFYLSAREVWDKAVGFYGDVVRRHFPSIFRLLVGNVRVGNGPWGPPLPILVYRYKALERYPEACIPYEEFFLLRKNPADQWDLGIMVGGLKGDEIYHPYYLRLGHLSPTPIQLRVSKVEGLEGETICAVVVTYRPETPLHRRREILPAACEVIIRGEEIHFAPWRVGIPEGQVEDILRAGVDGRKSSVVRQGDVLFSPTTPLSEEGIAMRKPTIPSQMEKVEVEGEVRYFMGAEFSPGAIHWGWAEVMSEEAILRHPDHYPIILPRGWWEWEVVGGHTQFRPSRVRAE